MLLGPHHAHCRFRGGRGIDSNSITVLPVDVCDAMASFTTRWLHANSTTFVASHALRNNTQLTTQLSVSHECDCH